MDFEEILGFVVEFSKEYNISLDAGQTLAMSNMIKSWIEYGKNNPYTGDIVERYPSIVEELKYGKKIIALKELRFHTGMSLKDAEAEIDRYCAEKGIKP